MSYKDYLGRSFGGQYITPTEAIDGTRQCPIGQMTLCVTSGDCPQFMLICIKLAHVICQKLLYIFL